MTEADTSIAHVRRSTPTCLHQSILVREMERGTNKEREEINERPDEKKKKKKNERVVKREIMSRQDEQMRRERERDRAGSQSITAFPLATISVCYRPAVIWISCITKPVL